LGEVVLGEAIGVSGLDELRLAAGQLNLGPKHIEAGTGAGVVAPLVSCNLIFQKLD